MNKTGLTALSLALLLSACAEDGSNEAAKAGPVGADKDAHGCIGSAGYKWCASTESCERPWELAEKEGFANSKEAFDTFCNG